MSQVLCSCGKVNLLVYMLVILFGISSWVDINGLWVELPILVQNLPEGWDLPSYMSVIIQIANVAPLVYTIVSSIWPHRMFEIPVIYTIICLGGVACLLLAFLWDVTSYIAGQEHSTALFVLQFFLALVDCTSSVAFLPFMSAFKSQYMTAYFIGEGFSGLIPGLVALGQGAGNMVCVTMPIFQNQSIVNSTQISINATTFGIEELVFNHSLTLSERVDANNTTPATSVGIFPVHQAPRFSVKIFFIQLMLLMIVSAVSFTLLNFWSYCKRARVDVSSELRKNFEPEYTEINSSTPLADITGTLIVQTEQTPAIRKPTEKWDNLFNQNSSRYKEETNGDVNISTSLFRIMPSDTDKTSDQSDFIGVKSQAKRMSKVKYALFLVLTAVLNGISNGLLPSIQTYSCLPYGIEQYHLSVTLSSIANPIACLASFLLKMKSVTMTVVMTLLGTGLTGYIVWTASASPTPPLVHHSAGPVLLVCSTCVVCLLFATRVL